VSGGRRVGLTQEGLEEVARAFGFETYGDFVAWRDRYPDEYEREYEKLKARAADGEES
jgi:hypothetical protein